MRKLLPAIIILAIIPLMVTAYAEAPSHVDVYDYPFNITLLEGGNFTLYNNATNNIYFDGAFSGMVYCGSISGNPDCDGFNNSKTFELSSDIFTPDTYYLNDNTYSGSTLVSTIKIESPTPVYVAPPTPEPIQPQNNSTDIITSSSVSIPTRESDYYNKEVVSYYNGRIFDSQGFDITPFIDTVEEIEPTTNSTTKSTDIEILDLRLQILKVLESIFKIILQ